MCTLCIALCSKHNCLNTYAGNRTENVTGTADACMNTQNTKHNQHKTC